jgi:hypothetical protein
LKTTKKVEFFVYRQPFLVPLHRLQEKNKLDPAMTRGLQAEALPAQN